MNRCRNYSIIAAAIAMYPGRWFVLHTSKSWHAAVSHASMLRHGDSEALNPEDYGFKAEMVDGIPTVLVQKLDW